MLLTILNSTQIGAPVLGIILPAAILALSIILSFWLIKYFSKNEKK